MITKITNLKVENLILTNAFIRCFTCTFGTLYLSTLFMLEVGQEKWPEVSQFVQIFTLIFIFFTNFVRRKTYYRFHKLIIMMTLVLGYLFATDPHQKWLIISFAVMTITTELIGDITATNIVANSVTQLSYKSISPQLTSYVTLANISASILFMLVQKYFAPTIFVVIFSLGLLMHLFIFHLLSIKPAIAEAKVIFLKEEKFFERIKETVQYGFQNPLILLIFALFIWSQVAKFFSDWLYLSSASTVFQNKDELSSFLGFANMFAMIIIFIVQKLALKKILSRFTPSILLALIPVFFLIFSTFGILLKSPLIGVCLNLIFLFCHKAIHMPTLQISLQSLNPQYKPRIILLMNFCISIVLIFVTTGLRSVKEYLNADFMYVSIIILGMIGLWLIIQFEGHYFKNLWQNFLKRNENLFTDLNIPSFSDNTSSVLSQGFNPHDYFSDHYEKIISQEINEYIESIQLFPIDDSSLEFREYYNLNTTTPFEKSLMIMNIYLFTKNLSLFSLANKFHQSLMNSLVLEEKEKAHQIFAIVDTPEFRQHLKKGEYYEDEILRNYCTKLILTLEKMEPKLSTNDSYHLRLKIFGLLNWEYLTGANHSKILNLLNTDLSDPLKKFIYLLSKSEINLIKHDIIKCWEIENKELNIEELTKRYLASDKLKRKEFQEIMYLQTVNDPNKVVIQNILSQYLSEKKSELNTDEILDLLFLKEWSVFNDPQFDYVLKSIKHYPELDPNEKSYWKDFHLEFLKKINSQYFSSLVQNKL